MSKTVAVDFDGVIHAYSKGWHDGTIYDGPMPDAARGMQTLIDCGYDVVIYSTRCHDRVVDGEICKNQVDEMRRWLTRHKVPYSRISTEPGKPLCVAFIDDRAIKFQAWSVALRDLDDMCGSKTHDSFYEGRS